MPLERNYVVLERDLRLAELAEILKQGTPTSSPLVDEATILRVGGDLMKGLRLACWDYNGVVLEVFSLHVLDSDTAKAMERLRTAWRDAQGVGNADLSTSQTERDTAVEAYLQGYNAIRNIPADIPAASMLAIRWNIGGSQKSLEVLAALRGCLEVSDDIGPWETWLPNGE